MTNKLLKSLLIGCLLNISSTATAGIILTTGIINFGTTSSDFTINELEDKGFLLKSTAEGFGILDADRGRPFSTGHDSLITWTNIVNGTSGFTLETINDDLFSLQSFQPRTGYADGTFAVTGITLEGLLYDGSVISEDFSVDRKANLSDIWTNLVSVEFIAFGELNRAAWDSIRFETFAAPANATSVSEPSTIAIFTLCLLGLMTRKFKRKS
tara:strand:- start:1416 stop:2051 length:636 start_codon:yes stop_codon:yes gene_type:complete